MAQRFKISLSDKSGVRELPEKIPLCARRTLIQMRAMLIREHLRRKELLLPLRSTIKVFETGSCTRRNIFCTSFHLQIKDLKNTENNDMPDTTIENPYQKEKKQCVLCKYKVKIDYKNTKLLSQFVSPFTGQIYDKHITGLCDHQQKAITYEIKRAQIAAFMPIVLKEPRFLKDPKLFDPFNPQRPHPH